MYKDKTWRNWRIAGILRCQRFEAVLAHYHNLFLTMKENCQDLHRNVFYFGHLLFFAKTTLVGNDSCLWTSRLVKPVSLWHTMKKWISKTLYRPGLSWILWKIRNCEGGDHRLCDLLIFTSRWKLVIHRILGGKLGGHGKVSPAGHGGHGRQRGEDGQQGLNLYSFSVCILWDHTIFIFYAILIF